MIEDVIEAVIEVVIEAVIGCRIFRTMTTRLPRCKRCITPPPRWGVVGGVVGVPTTAETAETAETTAAGVDAAADAARRRHRFVAARCGR